MILPETSAEIIRTYCGNSTRWQDRYQHMAAITHAGIERQKQVDNIKLPSPQVWDKR